MTTTIATPVSVALSELARLGPLLHPARADQIPKGHFVYLVANGENILQLGKGRQARARLCTRGGRAGKHNKAFICAVGELVLGRPNTYSLLPVASKDVADAIELSVLARLGIQRNEDDATLIQGITAPSISGIHEALWERAKTTSRYRSLDPVEQLMAEELFELVTYCTTLVLRSSGKIIASHKGDNLEGNILMNVDRRHLANTFVKLTSEYLSYGPRHRLADEDFERLKAGYTYTPRRCRFEISNFQRPNL